MMDAISDPHVRKVVVKSCAQIGKTDALVLNTIGYYMNYNPSPLWFCSRRWTWDRDSARKS